MQRSLLLALIVVLAMLYGCGQEASKKPVEQVVKPTADQPAPVPTASIGSLHDEVQKMLEMVCQDWASKDMGAPPDFCIPAGLSPAFCHSSSSPAFCK